MIDFSLAGLAAVHAVDAPGRLETPARSGDRPRPGRDTDRVELSDHARWMGAIRDGRDIRRDLVERVRGEIAAGRYESPAKIRAAAEALGAEFDRR